MLISKIHQNTTDYSYFVDVSISIRDQLLLVPASSSDESLWWRPKRQQSKR